MIFHKKFFLFLSILTFSHISLADNLIEIQPETTSIVEIKKEVLAKKKQKKQSHVLGNGLHVESYNSLGLKPDFNILKYQPKHSLANLEIDKDKTKVSFNGIKAESKKLFSELKLVYNKPISVEISNNMENPAETSEKIKMLVNLNNEPLANSEKKENVKTEPKTEAILSNFILVEQMQNLASFISGNYKIPLISAEKIVLTAYKESPSYNIDPIFFLSLISIESKFQQFVTSKAGAIGLSQVIPKYHKDNIAEVQVEHKDLWSIEGNMKLGLKVFSKYINLAKGNLSIASQLYNGSSNDPNKTYSRKIMSEQEKLKNVAFIEE